MIIIDWIIYLIDNIPTIISYIAYGYIYLVAYYWVSFKDNNDLKNFIIKSVAVSYLLNNLYELFINKFNIIFKNTYNETVLCFVISALLGLFIGRITVTTWFNELLNLLHIGRTINNNIWDDIIKPRCWVRIFMKDGSSYLGQYKYGEPFKSEPIILLINYQKLDKDSDVVIDNSQNPCEAIVLNTKDFDRIEITYRKKLTIIEQFANCRIKH